MHIFLLLFAALLPIFLNIFLLVFVFMLLKKNSNARRYINRQTQKYYKNRHETLQMVLVGLERLDCNIAVISDKLQKTQEETVPKKIIKAVKKAPKKGTKKPVKVAKKS